MKPITEEVTQASVSLTCEGTAVTPDHVVMQFIRHSQVSQSTQFWPFPQNHKSKCKSSC
jgi:hypothetical protein